MGTEAAYTGLEPATHDGQVFSKHPAFHSHIRHVILIQASSYLSAARRIRTFMPLRPRTSNTVLYH